MNTQETQGYKGHTIKIFYDDNPENPWEAWEGNMPLIYISGRNEKDYSDGNIDRYILSQLTTNKVIRHQGKLLAILNIEKADFNLNYPSVDYSKQERADEIENLLSDEIENIEVKKALCQLLKIPYLNTSRSGYSQGDYADIFICPTAEFFKETGYTLKHFTEEAMAQAADLWAAWAYGDVYGYQIEDESGEQLDSCWGYYGDDHRKNGLLDEAEDQIDYYIREANKTRLNKLKSIIKAHVPIIYRPVILSNI